MKHLAYLPGVKKLTLLLSLLTVAGTSAAQNAAPATPLFPVALDRYIEQAMRDWEVPGLAIAVVRNDTVIAAKGYGVRELGKTDPVDANTVFNIASLTKSFTAAGAAILVDGGKISWDTPVHTLLPNLAFRDRYLTQEVTVRDLLSHRTGLHPANMMWQMTNITRADMIRHARFLELDRLFRTELVYSNVGFTIAGEALAAAAGTSYEDLIRQRLFVPLGMRSTSISMAELARQTNKVSPHAIFGGVQRPFQWRDIDIIAPAGAINSTATDMATWLRFQMGDGTYHGRRLISVAQMWEMHSPQAIIPVTAAMKRGRQVRGWAAYALGWQVMDYQGHPMLWHSGNGDGQPALMTIFPDDRLGIVVMVNTWAAGLLHAYLTNKIADTFLNLPVRDWSGEALPRKALIRGQDAQRIAELRASRGPERPASHDFAAYAGTYVDSLYGEQTVRLANGQLTMQMNGGQIADLTHWSYDTFLATWRDPLFREEFPALVTFNVDSQGNIVALVMQLNRDRIVSTRRTGS